MQRHQHAGKFPNIIWNKPQPMTDEELIALAAKCMLINPSFQKGTFFNEDSWYSIGKLGMTTPEADHWRQNDFEIFMRENRTTDTNHRKQMFLSWLEERQAIHPKGYDPTSPEWEVADDYVAVLLEAIENPQPLSSKVFGSCDVFISHITGDCKAEELRQALGKYEDLSIYMTPEMDPIEQGSNWPQDIIKHLRAAKIVVIVLTDESKKSPAVNQEIGFTLGDNKKRLVWFSGTNPSYILLPGDIQECPMSQFDADEVAERISQIVHNQ